MKEKLKKYLIQEKGSITVFVVAVMLFMVTVLSLSYMSITNSTAAQRNAIKQIEKEYDTDIEQTYEEVVENVIHLIPSNTEWTNEDVVVTVDYGGRLTRGRKAGIGSANIANATTVTLTENGTVYAEAKDIEGNKVTAKLEVKNIDKVAPTYTSAEVKNITTTGYDVYVYGVTDGEGSGVNRVQFPTWTAANGQDDLVSNWGTNSKVAGEKQADGTTWVYRVNVTDHNSEYGLYYTHIYAYDNLGNRMQLKGFDVQVPGVVMTFNANGGTVTQGTITKGYASKIGTLPTPTRAGHTFTGWYTAQTGGTKITEETIVPANNVTYYAQWTVNSYTVAYNANGGTGTMSTDTVVYGTNYTTKANTFTRTGYTFKGWNEKADGTGTDWTSWIEKPWQWTYTKDVTLYAQWTINQYYIDLNMKVDGTGHGSGYNNRVTVGLKIGGVDKGYVQDHYTQWNYGTSWEVYGLKIDGVSVAYTAKGTLGAQNTGIWIELNTMTFTVNNTNYGSVSSSELLIVSGQTYSTSGSTLTLADGRKVTATKTDTTGYTTALSSWSPASGTVSSATTITANFTRTIITYTISYTLNSGTVTGNPTSYNVGTDTITLKNPTRDNYVFSGWTGSNGTTAQTTVTIPKGSTGNKTYTANWTEANYSVNTNPVTYTITLAQAVAAASNGSTITVLKDYTDASSVSINKNLTINKNGHTITRTAGITVAANTNVTLTVNGTGTITSSSNAIINYGTGSVIINGGEIKGTGTVSTINNSSTGKIEIKSGTVSSSNATTIHNETSGTITLSGGTINSTGTSIDHRGIYNKAAGTITISSGTLKTNQGRGIYNNSTGKVNVTGGTFTTGPEGIYMYKGTLTITTASISSWSSAIYVNNDTTTTIQAGTYTSTAYNGIHCNGGTTNINGGTFTGKENGIYSEGVSKVSTTGGTFVATGTNAAVKVVGTSNLNFKNSTIKSNNTSNPCAIINDTDRGDRCIVRSRASNYGITGSIKGYVIATTNTSTGQASEKVRFYNAATKYVFFPTWTEKNGQDDVDWWGHWTEKASGTNYNETTINKSKHNNETGTYNVHIYESESGESASKIVGEMTLNF